MKRSDYVRMERRMLDQMDESDAAHGSKHVYRVLYLALDIAAHEPEADADVVIAACLLHDIARAEQAKDPSVDHARAGAEKARSLLLEEGFDAEFAQAVSDCVRTHRFRSDDPPVSLEAKILFDADKLDVSGAVGAARTLQYGTQFGEPLYTLDEAGRVCDGTGDAPDSFMREYRWKLQRIYGKFCTKRAEEIAASRRKAAQDYYDSVLRELQEDYEIGRAQLNGCLREPD